MYIIVKNILLYHTFSKLSEDPKKFANVIKRVAPYISVLFDSSLYHILFIIIMKYVQNFAVNSKILTG